LLEQYLNKISKELKVYLLERNPKTAKDASRMSDEYFVIHRNDNKLNKPNFAKRNFENNSSYHSFNTNNNKNRVGVPVQANQGRSLQSDVNNTVVKQVDSVARNQSLMCAYCHKTNHDISHCYKRKADNVGHVQFVRDVDYVSNVVNIANNNDEFKNPYIFPLTILGVDEDEIVFAYRDTGSSVSILKDGVVSVDALLPTNRTINLQYIQGCMQDAPIFKINVTSGVINGCIEVAVVPFDANIPWDMILGNDNGPRLAACMQCYYKVQDN
jgi:hypothetical protein